MSKKLKLVISKPPGYKGDMPLVGAPAQLVNVDTGEVVPGIRNIQLNFPAKGVISCLADIVISDIEFADVVIISDGTVKAADIQAGKAFVDIHVNQQAEPGNGEETPK